MFLTKFIFEMCNGDGVAFNGLQDWFLCDCNSHHPEYHIYRKRMEKPEFLTIQTVIDIITKFGDKEDRKIIGKYKTYLIRDVMVGQKKRHRSILNFNLRKRKFLYHFVNKPIPRWWGIERIKREYFYRETFLELMKKWVEERYPKPS